MPANRKLLLSKLLLPFSLLGDYQLSLVAGKRIGEQALPHTPQALSGVRAMLSFR